MTYFQKLSTLNQFRGQGKHAERICSELVYLDGVSKNNDNLYDHRIEAAADYLLNIINTQGAITFNDVKEIEKSLEDLIPVAKSYTELFISHAHIDMNWMWGYNETAALTVDTFRTVLNLMKEYPEMTYGQSQASTYEIIEKYCPELLPEIKERIAEGRWEVTAAEWVEPDKNMPDGESLTRQILQTKKYLSDLLDIDPDSLDIDFVPDTFGHNLSVPETLVNAGIKYMYHCRGYDGPDIYYYVSPSGKKTLNYKEHAWYNGEITPTKFEIVPGFCAQEKVNTYLCVFGVGDHGGGPSRRDIERIMEYKTWPLTPTIRFGTFKEFFTYLSQCGTAFPEVNKELNFLFTGCYTTQSRIKMANRISEARINEAEILSAQASAFTDDPIDNSRLDDPWRKILFNHFHDILPGSGTIETREYAMGRFQETLATVNVHGNNAMKKIADAIDTSGLPFDNAPETVSEGAGAGFGQNQSDRYIMPVSERGRGSVRVLHLFNTTNYERTEPAEVTVWDYPYDLGLARMTDTEGNEIPFCLAQQGNGYWGHNFTKLLVKATIPPLGYTTVILKQVPGQGHLSPSAPTFEHTDSFINDEPFIMQNDLIKAVFNKQNMELVSLTDKISGKELISQPSCYFQLIQENPLYNMTSWRVGPYMSTQNLNEAGNTRLTHAEFNHLIAKVGYELRFGSSVLNCMIILRADSPVLEFDTRIDWNEAADWGVRIPQINFAVPVSYATSGHNLCNIPYGVIRRQNLAHDVPALSFISAEPESGKGPGVALMTDTKYGYRSWEDKLSVTLIRSAYDPDPYPERGVHNIRIGVAAGNIDKFTEYAGKFNHPVFYAPGTQHSGKLPLTDSFVNIEGALEMSCVKNSEDGKGIALRLYNLAGSEEKATLRFCRNVLSAAYTDSNERASTPIPSENISGADISITVGAYETVTIVVRFS